MPGAVPAYFNPSLSASTIQGRPHPPIGSRPTHLKRANELVRLSKKRVVDTQRGVGIANLSLADTFAQLAKANKIKDHLVFQALEGCRPVWDGWLNNNSS
ncbi:uncharacterized protein PGTG_06887 [Puccinia graminis f. sp. tritici CRL 75-36-700-3]|uniref:Uncharacterized protein n=1 Tax=Puccinia graminis f. sp. tritici (strain CRL 75-36-700-3 / race SCCL) TaxID=418459 RepID=E3KAA9_PUCGT|nr:uncharacterized protein PGTG_06887 [Puccinia graminis f. sp. tritici CRL 75-36-700-3]EFP81266.2 hypothetical protein PGTG_06887 [Puccinia graminis f. sp. tritici CRL 75-36-700-3]